MSEQEWLDIFGDNLRSIMAEYGYTQGELADATGISKSSISYYVNKEKVPSVRALINISYELNMSLDELMDFGSRIES